MNPYLNLLKEGEIELICNTARKILKKKGLRFVAPEVLQVFQKHGFQITDNDVVHINSKEIDAALKTTPQSFTRKGADPSQDVLIGEGISKFAIGSVPIWIIEQEENGGGGGGGGGNNPFDDPVFTINFLWIFGVGLCSFLVILILKENDIIFKGKREIEKETQT